jgi:hypothetical protein
MIEALVPRLALTLVAVFVFAGAPYSASSQDSNDPFHLYPKRGVRTTTQAGDWTLTIEEDVIARKPITVYAALTTASLTSPDFSLECHPFNARIPGFHRLVIATTNAYYVAWPPSDLPPTTLRVGNNEPIRFLGVPTAGVKGGVETGSPEIWQRVLAELPDASTVAIEVQNAQAIVSVRGFVGIKDKLLAACDDMDR